MKDAENSKCSEEKDNSIVVRIRLISSYVSHKFAVRIQSLSLHNKQHYQSILPSACEKDFQEDKDISSSSYAK